MRTLNPIVLVRWRLSHDLHHYSGYTTDGTKIEGNVKYRSSYPDGSTIIKDWSGKAYLLKKEDQDVDVG